MSRCRAVFPLRVVRRVLILTVTLAAGVSRSQSVEEPELAQIYGDKSFVSIATGTRQPTSRAPSTATVITAEEIKASGFVDLDEVLETVPGFHVARSTNYNPLYVVRGIKHPFTDPHVLMLVNGIPVTSAFWGDRGAHWGWHSLPVENIARVEVVRGPGSALYGADAFAGVINIITKTSDEIPGNRIGVIAGSFDTYGAWWQYGGRRDDVSIAAYLQAGTTRGPRGIVTEDFQTSLDRASGTGLSLAPGPAPTGHDALDAHIDLAYRKWRLRADYNGRFRVRSGTGSFQALSPAERGYHNRVLTDLTYQDDEFARDWAVSAQVSFLYMRELLAGHLLPPGVFGAFPEGPTSTPGIWQRHGRFDASVLYTGLRDHRLRFGAGAALDQINKVRDERNFRTVAGPGGGFALQDLGMLVDFSNTESFLFPQTRNLKYVYVQDEYLLGKDLYLTAGVRHDRYSDFGGTTNPRIALVWEAAYDITAKLMYGRAFRAPTFDDQYNTFFGPPRQLKPERIEMIETALVWRPTFRSQLSMNLFRYKMRDVIVPVAIPDPATGTFTFSNANRGRQNGWGGELEAAVDVTRSVRISGNFAYQRAIDKLTDSDSADAPRRHLFLRGEWRFAPRWALSSQLNWIADFRRAIGDPRPPIPDYHTVDLTLRTDRQPMSGHAGQWTFSASVRNLFNADAREPSVSGSSITYDLPQAKRSYIVEASTAF
ncbi:MAG TPA: TonB-dependent receptor [Burkholderiaceae bacterium]|nr:TonB-dependent receptor [Burkholderiaceae bacterium]